MYKIRHLDIGTIELLSGNIFLISVNAGAHINLDNAQLLICTINEMLPNDHDYRAGIFDLSNISTADLDAGHYLVSGKDLKGFVSGVALISSTATGTTIGDMIVSIHDPQVFPIRFFNSPIRAEHWVRTSIKSDRATLFFTEQLLDFQRVI